MRTRAARGVAAPSSGAGAGATTPSEPASGTPPAMTSAEPRPTEAMGAAGAAAALDEAGAEARLARVLTEVEELVPLLSGTTLQAAAARLAACAAARPGQGSDGGSPLQPVLRWAWHELVSSRTWVMGVGQGRKPEARPHGASRRAGLRFTPGPPPPPPPLGSVRRKKC